MQADLLDMLATRVVAPLIAADKAKAARRLNPEFTIGETRVIMSTAELAGIPVRTLGTRLQPSKIGAVKS